MFLPYSLFDGILKKYNQDASAEKLSKMSVLFSVLTSIILVCLKFCAWITTNSITMQASLLDSSIDAISSSLAFIALIYAFKKADEDHGYGHGKVEGLASLAQVVFMSAACWELLCDAYDALTGNGEPVVYPLVGISVMIVSTILVYLLVSFQLYIAKKTQSTLVTSDSLHYSSDLLMNVGVMISFIVSNFIPYLDALVGIGVGLYVFVAIVKVFNASMKDLMDAELPKDDKLKIIEVVKSDERVLKILHLKTRRSGTRKIVQIDIELSREHSFEEAFRIAKDVENAIASLFLHSEVVVITAPSNDL